MNWLFASGVCLLLVFIQTAILPGTRFFGVRPDLVVMAVVIWSLHRGAQEGLGWAVVGGLMLDLLGSGPLGASIAGLGVAAFATGTLAPWLKSFRNALPVALIPIGVVIYYLVATSFLAATAHTVSWSALAAILPAAIATDAIVSVPLYLLLLAAATRLRPVDWQPA